MMAERDTTDRYLAAYLAERIGQEFTGRISGVARFGAFVRLDETGADGLIPIRSLGQEFFHFDREAMTLMGSQTGMLIEPGMRVTVRLAEAAPVTGGLELELLELEGGKVSPGPRRSHGGRGGPRKSFGPGKGPGKGKPKGNPKRKLVRAKAKSDKTKRKITRNRG